MRRAGGVGVPRRESRRPLRRLATGVLWLKAWAAKATDDQLKVGPVEAHDSRGNDGAIEPEGELRQSRRGHSWATEERYRDAIVHFLVDEHRKMAAPLHCCDRASRTAASFR